jgi:hypothetical protein
MRVSQVAHVGAIKRHPWNKRLLLRHERWRPGIRFLTDQRENTHNGETTMDQTLNWGAEAWRQPTVREGDEVLFEECGRILEPDSRDGVDCRSHSFKIVKSEYGDYLLYVSHGGGEERIKIDYCRRIVPIFGALDSDQRYWLMHSMLSLAHDQANEARDRTSALYRKAFVEGRLKKRKMPGRDCWKVSINPQ